MERLCLGFNIHADLQRMGWITDQDISSPDTSESIFIGLIDIELGPRMHRAELVDKGTNIEGDD